MNKQEATEILRKHNEWRRYDGELGKGPEMTDPKKLGEAIDTIVAAIEEAYPECKEESEDERIRKALICHLNAGGDFKADGVTKEEMLAYLGKQKENKEYVFRPLAGTDITIAAEQAIRRANEGDRLVLAFNGAYIPVRKGCDANKIVDIYEAFIEKKREASEAIEAVERIDKYIDEHLANAHDMKDSNPEKKYYRGWDDALAKMSGILQGVYAKQKEHKLLKVGENACFDPDTDMWFIREEQKPVETTICGQDYKCKKDYKVGNCWYIKDVLYHCSRDGYLTDQNGVSWSCTPEWFNEYIYTNNELADEEKNDFVSGQFLKCKLSFGEFKEGEHYWLEYIGDDMYVGRSDNILNQKFHIAPRQLYTLFSQQLDEEQEPPKKEEQVSSEYETPMFEETPSDEQIIDALIHHLNEQDGFLTAINCVSTKAILSWLKKQKEQESEEKSINWTELTWKDINELEGIINNVHYEFRNGIGQESFGKEVLERFREYKGDEYLDEIEQKPVDWKPSKEQKEGLFHACNRMTGDYYHDALVSLYNDLKKLMEE